MLSPLKHADAKREGGFTLIELLVVVIIIGILAAIAIPVFLAQRERGWRSAAVSDLRNMAVSQETYYTDSGLYTNTLGELVTRGYNRTADMGLAITTTAATGFVNGQVWCIATLHRNLDAKATTETQYLGSGGTVSNVVGTGCPQTAAPGAISYS